MQDRLCILGLGLALLLAAGCVRRAAPPASAPLPAEAQEPVKLQPRMEAVGIHWALPDDEGRPLWDLRAERGFGTTAEGFAELEKVRCKVYAEGKLAMEAAAPRVKADYHGKRLAFTGGVTARTADGRRSFRSESISLTLLEENRSVVEATGSVQLEVDGVALTGERLVTDPSISEGRLSGE